MSKNFKSIDRQIADLGYVIDGANIVTGGLVYRNDTEKCKVALEWNARNLNDEDYDPNDDCIYAYSIAEHEHDGYIVPEPMGLNVTELKLFIQKLEQLKHKEA